MARRRRFDRAPLDSRSYREPLDGRIERYDRYDFASYRGAEEAYRVRDVRPPPPSDEEAAEQAAARVDAARRAANQTRAKVRLEMLMLE